MPDEITIPADIEIREERGVFVLAQPSTLDPMLGRVALTVTPGRTLAQILETALPQATGAMRDRVRITLGGEVILPGLWHLVRPKPGAQVMIRAVPGGDVLRNVLTIAVTVAALSLGGALAPIVAPSLIVGAGGTQIASAAITFSTPCQPTLVLDALKQC